MLMEVYHSVAYGLLTCPNYVGITVEISHREDAFGNVILYSIEDGLVTIFAKSLLEVNMNTDEMIERLTDCIINSLECGYYAPKLIIYKSERSQNHEYYKKKAKRNVIKRTFKFSKKLSLWKSSL